VLAVASSFLFFGSILLHELGHALAARRDKVAISGINLWMFGGITGTAETKSAGSEFRVAAAGPLVTLAIVVALTAGGLATAGSEEFSDALKFQTDSGASGPLAMVAWLATMNALVLILNLIPAFPLDGGRIARAIAWWRTGDRLKATRFAATLGRIFGNGFVILGLYLILTGGDAIAGVWLALVGFIIGQAAKAALVQTALAAKAEEEERKRQQQLEGFEESESRPPESSE
jgi:Zn-dependent protease